MLSGLLASLRHCCPLNCPLLLVLSWLRFYGQGSILDKNLIA
jgi:hypothetical protein